MSAGPDDDDEDLFRRVFADAKPLKKKRPVPEHPAAKAGRKVAAKTPPDKKTAGRPAPRVPVAAAPAPKPVRALAAGDYTGMDRRTAKRFRKGKMAIEGRLDLHGMYQDAAHAALNDFIRASAAQGRRKVLVITGRGSREGTGVLRERLPQWLNQPPCRDHVVSFTTARPQHGRDGAFYVLLRRKRGDAA